MNDEGRASPEAALPQPRRRLPGGAPRTRDHHHAEDMAQETCLWAFSAFESHRGPSTKAREQYSGVGRPLGSGFAGRRRDSR